jgi:hypothetical protein
MISTLRVPLMRRPKAILALALAAAGATAAGAIDWLVRDPDPRALVTDPTPRRADKVPTSSPSTAQAPEPPSVPVTSLPVEDSPSSKSVPRAKPSARRYSPAPKRKGNAEPEPPRSVDAPASAPVEAEVSDNTANASEVSISITKPPLNNPRPKAPDSPDPLSRRK